MSAQPLGRASGASAARRAAPRIEPPRLRLLPPHEHAWQLLVVHHDDGATVQEFACSGCGEVTYRSA